MAIKKRNPIISGLFSLFQPGLGQFYNGEVKKGLIFFLAPIAFTLILYLSPILKLTGGIFVPFIILIFIRFFAAFEAAKSSDGKRNYTIKKINNPLYYILIFIGCGFFSGFVVSEIKELSRYKSFKIPTPNMQNTILVGDFIVADVKYFSNNPIDKGDIVLFEPPVESSTLWIQRIVGTEGDTILLKNGDFYLNGEFANFTDSKTRTNPNVLDSTYQDPQIYNSIGNSDNFGPYIVPANSVFLLGDNRDNSFDSRFFGFVNKDKIIGKPLYIWYSHNEGIPREERILKEIN